jgi:uncharacterized protein
MSPLRLLPQRREFFDLFTKASANAVAIAQLLVDLLDRFPDGTTDLLREMKELEHEGDRLTSELFRCIQAQFQTPYDREDIVELVFAVDEVADKIENASELLGLYGVEQPTRQSVELCRCLVRATEELASLLGRLKGLRGSAEEVVRIKAIEDEADQVARNARAGLFKDDRIDPVLVIRWKDIYEALEDAVDACDTAGNRVGNILVKNT